MRRKHGKTKTEMKLLTSLWNTRIFLIKRDKMFSISYVDWKNTAHLCSYQCSNAHKLHKKVLVLEENYVCLENKEKSLGTDL